jgi:Spy/CpxP family protein refolding chaperone
VPFERNIFAFFEPEGETYVISRGLDILPTEIGSGECSGWGNFTGFYRVELRNRFDFVDLQSLFTPLMKESVMLRNLAIAFATVAVLALAVNVQAQQGQGGGRRGQGGGMGMMGGGMMGGGGIAGLLQNEKVQKEIELTAEQKEKIQKIGTEAREAMRSKMGDMQNLSQEERRAKFQEMRKDMEEAAAQTEKKIEGALLPNQVKRIKEIQLQVQGIRALANADVQKELGLTDDQKAKLKAIDEEAAKGRPQFTPGQRPSQEDFQKMRDARTETEKKLTDVLTDEQKKKLEEMKGEKFDTSGLRGGFGGQGGQGGGRRGNRGGNNNPAPVN